MKHILILFFAIISFVYYQFNVYNNKAEFQQIYNSKKKELLVKQDEKQIKSIKIVNIDKYPINIISKTYAEETSIKLKNKVNLEVRFYSQSPFWKWWKIFNETCEEASVLIAINYALNKQTNKTLFRDELLKIVDWENKKFWDYRHTNVKQTAQILEEYFNFTNYEIINNPTILDIKKNLNEWNIIIAPFYWIWLNPHYLWRWPEYHFMVIKGYDSESFITHDVWTKHWKNYRYNQKKLFDRIHDYNSESIQKWKKKIIILKK